MNCLSRVSSYAAVILSKTTIPRQCYSYSYAPLAKSTFDCARPRTVDLQLNSSRFRVQCFASRPAKASPRKLKSDPKRKPTVTTMEPQENTTADDSFFVVRKGDVVGVYNNFSDCQAQVGSSICDPPVSIFKGHSLPGDAEAYLRSHGLHNALYTIRAADLKEDLFGTLVPCPCKQPASSEGEAFSEDVITKRRAHEDLGPEITQMDGSTEILTKHAELDADIKSHALHTKFCFLEFDGASKGNPGKAGAGVVLRDSDGSLICRLREGLGIATNNAAEYRAMILGLKHALQKGYTKICVKGDSKLVCMQMQGSWKVKHPNISNLYEQAKNLTDGFLSFQIDHVMRELNSEADEQANLAVQLADGQVQEVFD